MKGKRASKFDRAEFIGWDGEGTTEADGTHVYVLLANSLGQYAYDSAGLSTVECLTFMAEAARLHPHAIHVCFGASYDVNMMLRDVPRYKLVELWEGLPEQVWFGDFMLSYKHRKSFNVSMLDRSTSGKNREMAWLGKMVLWDVFGFFQGSFVSALEKWLGEDYPDLAFIREMKLKRSQFKHEDIEEVKRYCFMELKALVRLMEKVQEHAVEAGLRLARWDGAGAVAAALLKREGVKAYMQDAPLLVRRAAQHAYAGGRVELLKFGTAT